MKWLKKLAERIFPRKKAPEPPPKNPHPESPYHRIYTKNRSFEELARRRPPEPPKPKK